MDIPPDPDDDSGTLEQLLAAGPSLLDDMVAASAPPPGANQLLATVTQPRRSYRQPNHQVVPFGRPGSLTRPVGVNDSSVGGGDRTPQGANVLRENMRHFGIAQTRFR